MLIILIVIYNIYIIYNYCYLPELFENTLTSECPKSESPKLVFSIGVGTTPIPCPTRQDELMAKMGEKYPSKLMVSGANICQRPRNLVPLHCQSDGAARHLLPIGTRQDAHRLGTSSGRARRIVRSGSARETNVRNTRSTLVALHL